MSDYISVKKTSSQEESFNHSLSSEVRRANTSQKEDDPRYLEKVLSSLKKILPLPQDVVMQTVGNLNLPSHPWVGAKFKEKETGNIYVSEKVCFQFYGGWYYGVLLNHNGSHTFLHFENHSCMNESILEGIQEFHERFDKI